MKTDMRTLSPTAHTPFIPTRERNHQNPISPATGNRLRDRTEG